MFNNSRNLLLSCAILISVGTEISAKSECKANIASKGKVHELKSTADIDNIMKETESKAMILDFGAEWCGYCKKAAPKFEELAAKHPHVAFISVDTDEEAGRAIGAKYRVSGLPTFVFIQNGQEKDRAVGFNDDMLTNKINSFANMAKSMPAAAPAKELAAPAVKKEEVNEAELDKLIKSVEAEMKTLSKEEKQAEAEVKEIINKDEKQLKKAAPAKKAEKAAPAKKDNAAQGKVKELKSYAHLEEIVASSDKPVVVKFYAKWCPHCKSNAPVYKALASEMNNDAVFVQMEEKVMQNHAAELEKFKIEVFPTVVVMNKTTDGHEKVPNKPTTFKDDVKNAVAKVKA